MDSLGTHRRIRCDVIFHLPCWRWHLLHLTSSHWSLLTILAEFLHHALYALVELRRHIECSIWVYIEPALCLSKVHLVVKLAYHNLLVLVILEPFDALPFFPKAELRWLARHNVISKTVLFTAAPVA